MILRKLRSNEIRLVVVFKASEEAIAIANLEREMTVDELKKKITLKGLIGTFTIETATQVNHFPLNDSPKIPF